jgi:syntaxin 16
MASRNLTKKFVEIRNAAKANRTIDRHFEYDSPSEGDRGLLRVCISYLVSIFNESCCFFLEQGNGSNDSSTPLSLKHTLPPVWVDRIEEVEEDISRIKLKMGEVDALHRKRLKVNFEEDETQQERAIEQKTREVTEVFHHAEGLLKKFGNQTLNDPDLTIAERTVRKNMQMSIAHRLQGLSLSFRAQQKVSF